LTFRKAKQIGLKVTYPHKRLVGVMEEVEIRMSHGWEVEWVLTAQLPCSIYSFISKILARTLEKTFETER
jgi:hypothetical protein